MNITIEDLIVKTWLDRLWFALQVILTGKVRFHNTNIILKVDGKPLAEFLEPTPPETEGTDDSTSDR